MVATDIMGVSGRAMIEALIAGQRDPQALARLARCWMKVKHAALVQALTGWFDDHHGELARMLLDQYLRSRAVSAPARRVPWSLTAVDLSGEACVVNRAMVVAGWHTRPRVPCRGAL